MILMSNPEILVLHGAPGSGKSTVAELIAESLRELEVPHAVIDVDELARTYPENESSFQWANLAAIWPNYVDAGVQKVVLPVLLDGADDLERLRAAAPVEHMTVCELAASAETLRERVTAREPNEYWQAKLRALVDSYVAHSAGGDVSDFRIETGGATPSEVANSVLRHLGWIAPSA